MDLPNTSVVKNQQKRISAKTQTGVWISLNASRTRLLASCACSKLPKPWIQPSWNLRSYLHCSTCLTVLENPSIAPFLSSPLHLPSLEARQSFSLEPSSDVQARLRSVRPEQGPEMPQQNLFHSRHFLHFRSVGQSFCGKVGLVFACELHLRVRKAARTNNHLRNDIATLLVSDPLIPTSTPH